MFRTGLDYAPEGLLASLSTDIALFAMGDADMSGEPTRSDIAPHEGERVLVVDDDAAVRMLVSEMLQELGFDSVEAVDGTTALRVLRSSLRIDLLITDVGLPGDMNGRDVADAAREIRPGLKVLFITGGSGSEATKTGRLAEGMSILKKPFRMEELLSQVQELTAA